jgi:hypothetical protein
MQPVKRIRNEIATRHSSKGLNHWSRFSHRCETKVYKDKLRRKANTSSSLKVIKGKEQKLTLK